MAREDVEVVRRFNDVYEGHDIAALIRAVLTQVDVDDPALVEAWAAQDPMMRQVHPEIVWDASSGGLTEPARGVVELTAWYRDWMGLWESYAYRIVEYRDLGDWVLVPSDVEARGRNGIPVEMRVFQIFRVREGKIATMRGFLTEEEALAAAAAAP
jgi:ketosteroid isomerase-like protein